MGDQDWDRARPHHSLGHAPEYDPLESCLSMGSHDNKVMLASSSMVIDAIRRCALICDHLDMDGAWHLSGGQSMKRAQSIAGVRRQKISVHIQQRDSCTEPHRDAHGELDCLRRGL